MGWIAGHVYNLSTDQPVACGEVAVGSYVFNICAGGYYLGVVPPGSYTITTTSNGYELFSISDFFIPEGELVTGDFGLEPMRVNKAMPWLMLLLGD